MDWNGWHSVAQARGDGLRLELLEGLERAALRVASVIELDMYRRDPVQAGRIAPHAEPCEIIPFPVLAKRRVVPERRPNREGLKPRQSRARKLSRPARDPIEEQPE